MRVLFLTHRLPYAPNRGDRIRAYHLLRELARFAEVSLFSLVHDDDEEARSGEVPDAKRVVTARPRRLSNLVRGAAALATSCPLTHSLLDAPDSGEKLAALVSSNPPDVVLAYCSGMARFAMSPPIENLPFVVDMVDVDSLKWQRLAERAAWPRGWIYRREARTLGAFEAEASRRARAVVVVNERERDALRALAPDVRAHVVPNGVDLDAFAPPGPAPSDPVVVFCGVMDYEPNVEAATWFAREVWPHVRQRHHTARFVIVGANPAATIRRLARTDESIEVTGHVEAVQAHVWRAALAVAPLHTAHGLQNKVLEALAAGLPVVVTPAVRDGLPCGVDRGCLTADTPEAFGQAVLALLDESPEARRRRAASSGIGGLGWPARLAGLRVIVEEAAAS